MNIQVVNQSSSVSDAEIAGWLSDLQGQLNNEFAAAWGTGPVTFSVPTNLDPTQPTLFVIENSDVQGALGYHDKDQNGVPFIRIFAADSTQASVALSSVASHELCEMLADPLVDSTVVVDDSSGTFVTVYIVEDCDPVEADSYNGPNGTALSNFVFPQWFDPTTPAGVQTDQMGTTPGPLQLSAGGYISFRQGMLGPWQQQFGDKARTKPKRRTRCLIAQGRRRV